MKAGLILSKRQALEETKAVLPSMKKKIQDALEKLEAQLEATGSDASEVELTKAKEVIASAKEAIKEDAWNVLLGEEK